MVSIKNIVWEVGISALFGGIVLYAIYMIGKTGAQGAGLTYNSTLGQWVQNNGTDNIVNSSLIPPSTNWSVLGAQEFTSNVSLIGLVLVIGLIAAVIGYVKFVRR